MPQTNFNWQYKKITQTRHRAETKSYTSLKFPKTLLFPGFGREKCLKLASALSYKRFILSISLALSHKGCFPQWLQVTWFFALFCYSMCDLQVSSVRICSAQYSTKQNGFLRAGLHFNEIQQSCPTIKENKHEANSFILTWLRMLHQPRWGKRGSPIKNSYLLVAPISSVLGIIK